MYHKSCFFGGLPKHITEDSLFHGVHTYGAEKTFENLCTYDVIYELGPFCIRIA